MDRFRCWYCGRFAKLLRWSWRYAETSMDVEWNCSRCGSCADGS